MQNERPLSTPGDRINPKDMSEEDKEELGAAEAKIYRAAAARANYMAIDRSDIRFAVKELTRHMSKPRYKDYQQLLHMGRYILGKPSVVTTYKYQKNYKIIDVWSDTDHAGCLETRKSTTGGIIMFGNHAIKHWSSTQTLIALSSGEAEYYGCVRAASHLLGIRSMIYDLGVDKKRLRIKTDASVAKALASRRGLGGVRHIEVNQLWLQEKVNNSDIEIEKVKGETNKSDALTKYKDGEAIKRQLAWTDQVIPSGRHSIAPKLSGKDPLEDMDNGGSDNGEEQLDNVIMHNASERSRAHDRPCESRVLGPGLLYSSRAARPGTIFFE